MNTQSKQIKLTNLIRIHPNIVQTYVLNHILWMKNAGIKTLIASNLQGLAATVKSAL